MARTRKHPRPKAAACRCCRAFKTSVFSPKPHSRSQSLKNSTVPAVAVHRTSRIAAQPNPSPCAKEKSSATKATKKSDATSATKKSGTTGVTKKSGDIGALDESGDTTGTKDSGATRSLRMHLPFPAEIRDRIYRYVLLSTDSEDSPLEDNWLPRGPDSCCLSVLLVSKQTYLEAFHIYYRYRNLEFSNLSALELFLKNIGGLRRSYVTHVSFVWNTAGSNHVYQLLQQCPNLRYLNIHIPEIRPLEYSGVYAALGARLYGQRYNHAEALRNVRGLEAVRFFDHGYVYKVSQVDKGESPDKELEIIEREYVEIDVSKRWAQVEKQDIRLEYGKWNELVEKLTYVRDGMMRSRLKKYQPQVNKKIDLFKLRKRPR